MKHLILWAIVSMFLVTCSSPANKMQSNDDIDLVKAYIRSVEAMDTASMGNYLADDYVGMGPSYGDSIRKKEAIENWKSNTTNLYQKVHYNRSRFAHVTIPEGENKGDWVANWAELNVTFKNGKSVTIWANTNYLVNNGKIVRSLTFYNEADALRQLGYQIVPPDTSEQGAVVTE